MSGPDGAGPATSMPRDNGVPAQRSSVRRHSESAAHAPADMQIFVATFDSSHYTWTGLGLTRAQAIDAVVTAWTRAGADPAYLHRDDINVLSGPAGTGFRDDRPVTSA